MSSNDPHLATEPTSPASNAELTRPTPAAPAAEAAPGTPPVASSAAPPGATRSQSADRREPDEDEEDYDDEDDADEDDDEEGRSPQGVSAAEMARRSGVASRNSVSTASAPATAARTSQSGTGGKSGKRSGRGRGSSSSVGFGWRELIIVAMLAVILGVTLTAVVFQFAVRPNVTETAEVKIMAPPPANPGSSGVGQSLGFVSRIQLSDEIKAVMLQVRQQNPDFEDMYAPRVEDGKVVGLLISGDGLRDLTALAHFKDLKYLWIHPRRTKSANPKTPPPPSVNKGPTTPVEPLAPKSLPLVDLTPLRELKLRLLHVPYTNVADLSVLSAMPLEELVLGGSAAKDLGPLAKCKTLKTLQLNECEVRDLSPLAGLPELTRLYLASTPVTDLSPLRGKKLLILNLSKTKVTDLRPLSGMPLESLSLEDVPATDLSPLREMKELVRLEAAIRSDADRNVIRSLSKLESLNKKRPSDVLAEPSPEPKAEPKMPEPKKSEPKMPEPKAEPKMPEPKKSQP